MKSKNTVVAGNLITGEPASGKTRLLAEIIENTLYLRPHSKLCCVGRKDLFDKLPPAIRQLSGDHCLLELKSVSDDNFFDIQVVLDFISEAEEVNSQTILAIDEIGVFWQLKEELDKLSKTLLRINEAGDPPLIFLLTSQNLTSLEKLLGGRIAYNFSNYSILTNRLTEKFYLRFGIDTKIIPEGEHLCLEKNIRIDDYGVKLRKMYFKII